MKNNVEILAETADWIALSKPAGLLSIPDREQSEPSLKDHLQEKYGKVFIVHRLDKNTSGLILFAKNETAHKHLSQQFELRKVYKAYMGLIHGKPTAKEGTINEPIMEHPVKRGEMIIHRKGKPSQTSYEVVQQLGMFCLVKCIIHTGRTHQIRVHMKHLGHPIVCDELYGSADPLLLSALKRKKFKQSKDEETEKPLLNRLALHAWQLSFTDLNGEKITLEAPLTKDLRAAVRQLEKWTG